jgi:hypothetical protein
MKKRQKSAWVMLFTLLFWWQASPVGAIENWTGLSETSAPVVITQLNQLAAPAPQVYIVSPRPEEIIADTTVAVQLQVAGTPIFKNAQLGLGPHLHLLLDRVPTESIYDLNAPITLSNLSPGTHTLQVLANKPWHESWKNPQAFAQVTFYVLAKSTDSPNAQTPQLISVQPTEVGAEPWLLDFYVVNAPSHVDAQHPLRSIADWRVRATVNEQSFEVNRDEPLYLRGLRPGVNVLKLEYLNAQGQVADSAVRVVKYQPNGIDGLSLLVRNELSIDQALTLFDPQSRSAVVQTTGAERSSGVLPANEQSTMPWNQVVPSMPQGNQQGNQRVQGNPFIQNNPEIQANPGIQRNPVRQGNLGTYGNYGLQGNSRTYENPGLQGNSRTYENPGLQGNSGTYDNPGMQGNSRTYDNPGMQGNSGTYDNPGMQGNSGTYGNPGMQGNSGTYGNPGMQGNSRMYENPGLQGNSRMYENPGLQGNSRMYENPGLQGNSRMYENPGLQGNSRMYENPGLQGNSGTYSNPGMQGNSRTYGNPGLQGNSGTYENSGMQGNSGTYGDSGMQWNSTMQRSSINPVAPQSIRSAPSKTFSNSTEVSQSKLPSSISSKNIALLPPVQPRPISPNPLTTEPKEPKTALAPEAIAGSAGAAIAPAVTKQPEKITATTPKVLPPSPAVPNSSNDKIISDASKEIAPLAPKAIAKVDPKSLPPAASEKVVDFKVIGQELLHTTSAKIKHFTNQIPPRFKSWSENFRHWLSDRMAAMRADPSPTTSVKSAQPNARIEIPTPTDSFH